MTAYVAIIVVPTLVLLALGLQSVGRQHEAMDALSEKYARLSMERIADGFEVRIRELGADALGDPELAGVLPLLSRPAGPGNQRAIRQVVARVAGRHAIALHLVLEQGTAMRYPLTTSPLPESVEDLIGDVGPLARGSFAAAWALAEREEIALGDPGRATDAYRRCADLQVPARLKAIALARAARCCRKAGDLEAAARFWREVADRYGEEHDLFHEPYGLVARLELFELPGSAGERARQARAGALERDLAGGRWEVSADRAAYFMETLSVIARRPAMGSPAPVTRFLTHLRLAGVVERTFVPPGELRVGEPHQAALHLDEADYPFLYASLATAAGNSAGIIAGLPIDPEWVRTTILPGLSARNGVPVPPLLVPARTRPAGVPDGSPSPIQLRAAFSGWWLVPPDRPAGAAAIRRDLLVFGGATTLVLGVLVLGVALLIRDVGRQRDLTQLRSDFVSGVSHQLRTPLTLIRLYSEMLTDYPDTSEHERRERLDVITSESQRLTTLIERVLDFSRVERGQKPYVLGPGDLAAAVRPVADLYARHLRRRGFSVDLQLDERLPVVRFDADAVADGVVTLMDNAAKYAGDGKYVRVRVASHGADGVALEVVDRGAGIPGIDRDRLFQPFFRGNHRMEKGGYGLGLFLVRHLMEAHAGRVEVESEPGLGSVFRLVFPVDRGA